VIRFLAGLLLVLLLSAEVIDRIAIIVGHDVITELQLEEDLRVTAFLNRTPISAQGSERRATADRLIQQRLIAREMALSHYPGPSDSEIADLLARIKYEYAGSDFETLIDQYQLTEQTLKEHLARQVVTLRFIENRFRPELGVSDTDVQNYYNRQLTAWKKQRPGVPPPSLDSSRDSIRAVLIQNRTDEALQTWLKEARRQVKITYLERNLQPQ